MWVVLYFYLLQLLLVFCVDSSICLTTIHAVFYIYFSGHTPSILFGISSCLGSRRRSPQAPINTALFGLNDLLNFSFYFCETSPGEFFFWKAIDGQDLFVWFIESKAKPTWCRIFYTFLSVKINMMVFLHLIRHINSYHVKQFFFFFHWFYTLGTPLIHSSVTVFLRLRVQSWLIWDLFVDVTLKLLF